jgi:hypothetical protein
MISLLAQVAGGIAGGYTLAQILIMAIVVIAVIAIFVAFVRYSGITIPPIVVTVFWIVLGAVVCIWAIRFVMSM